MTIRKISIAVLGLAAVLAITIGLTSLNHPIILKWVSGSARHLGSAMPATVFTNGIINDHVKVFYGDDGDSYIVSLAAFDQGMLQFININFRENWIGRPAATSENDYDLIAGHLFLSDAGGKFTPFGDDIKGLGFDPQLSLAGNEIQFNLPPGKLPFDSIRIVLP